MKLKDFTGNYHRMTRVSPARVTHHHVGVVRERVDDLAFTLVTPLRPDDRNSRHGTSEGQV